MNGRKLKFKKIIINILVSIVSLTLCFLVIEYGIAHFLYSNVDKISYKKFDSLLGWRLVPGTYWVKPSHTFKKHKIYINKFGMRNKDLAKIKQKEVKRIIISGDSFTFAEGIRTKDIFSNQMEKLLNENYSNNKYEVINAGVEGYGNAQELLFMKRLSDYNIVGDVYLLMVFTNDILDNLRLGYGNLKKNLVQPGFVLNNEGKIELKYLPQKMLQDNSANFIRVKKAPRSRFKTIEVIKTRIETFIQTKPDLVKKLNKLGLNVKMHRMPGLLNGWYRDDILDTAIPLKKALIREVRDEAKKKNAQFLICLIPSPIQVYPEIYKPILNKTFPNSEIVKNFLEDASRPQNIMKEICKELRISFFDLYPILYENNNKELYIPKNGHFTKIGHTIVAHNLATFIAENVEGKF